MKSITTEVLAKIIEALHTNSAYKLFSNNIGLPEEHTNDEPIALMWNLDEEKLFLLPYATKSNGWAKIAESQNPWVLLGYYSGYDCIDIDPFSYIADHLEYLEEQKTKY